MRKLSALLFVLSLCFATSYTLQAQQLDAQFGVSGIHSQSATNFDSTSVDHSPQSLSGGVYPSLGADFTIWHNVGFGGEVSWKASKSLYQGILDYRPIFYDFNAVYARKAGRAGFALMGGIGGQSTRFYQDSCVSFNPSTGQCNNFISSNHFLMHVGGALRLYMTPSWYLAPEIHYYYVHNNLEFTSPNVTRYGLNIGYTFGK
ncbi:MAG TPA: outer membrane beta-barrel protein [Terriglobales bacterium]|nr:outer membrane beta-barrel protein [Terriglobales bacterium]